MLVPVWVKLDFNEFSVHEYFLGSISLLGEAMLKMNMYCPVLVERIFWRFSFNRYQAQ